MVVALRRQLRRDKLHDPSTVVPQAPRPPLIPTQTDYLTARTVDGTFSDLSQPDIAFYWPERRVLLAGDAIVPWPTLAPGWPAFDLNLTQHRASLGRLADLDISVIGVVHGEPIVQDAAQRLQRLAHEA